MIFNGTIIECDKCGTQKVFEDIGKIVSVKLLRENGWSFSKTGLVTCENCKHKERKK